MRNRSGPRPRKSKFSQFLPNLRTILSLKREEAQYLGYKESPRAAGGGVVTEVGQDPEYGLFVILDHPDDYQSVYGHASRLLVTEGDTIAAGTVIALAGSTGRSTRPHLHFEIRRGSRAIDPRTVVSEVR